MGSGDRPEACYHKDSRREPSSPGNSYPNWLVISLTGRRRDIMPGVWNAAADDCDQACEQMSREDIGERGQWLFCYLMTELCGRDDPYFRPRFSVTNTRHSTALSNWSIIPLTTSSFR